MLRYNHIVIREYIIIIHRSAFVSMLQLATEKKISK